MKIYLTGASGFVGGALARYCVAMGDEVVVPRRVMVGGIPEWSPLPTAGSVIVHCAARVHVMNETALDPSEEFRRANVEGTQRLASIACDTGVRRFVYLSSIKVNGEVTIASQRYSPEDRPAPVDAYGRSKLEAEIALRSIAERSNLEIVVVRPVLVYGPGVRGNFATMLRFLRSGVPLPLASIDNRRSFIALNNLVSFLRLCAHHPAAANETFLVSDGDDLSTPDLLRLIGDAIGHPARLFPCPIWLLQALGALAGRSSMVARLTDSLQVDISKARAILEWHPQKSVESMLAAFAVRTIAS